MSKSRTLQHDRKKAEHLAASRVPSKTATISGFVRCAHCSRESRHMLSSDRIEEGCCSLIRFRTVRHDRDFPAFSPQDELSTFAEDGNA